MKLVEVNDKALYREIIMKKRILLFWNILMKYRLTTDGVIFSDYDEFGIKKLKNRDLIEHINEELEVYDRFINPRFCIKSQE